MKTREEKYLFRHWFLRYSSSGLTAILLFLLGIKMNTSEQSNNHWIVFLVISILMGIWFLFRYFSVVTMNNLVNKVYNGEITYENLFSYRTSKQRILQVIILTTISTVLVIAFHYYIFSLQHVLITLAFLVLESLGVILLSYQRASKKLHLAITAEAIEKSRFFQSMIIPEGTE